MHYILPFGGRTLLFLWEAIQRAIGTASSKIAPVAPVGLAAIPMAGGRVAHG